MSLSSFFTAYGPSLLGGIAIGAAASLLLAGAGRTAGVSGIAAGLLVRRPLGDDLLWRIAFLGGLVAGGLGLEHWRPGSIAGPRVPLVLLLTSGVLVGLGTRLGGGCTSGHGICGLARLSRRSLVAVVIFMLAGAFTVALARKWGVGA